MRIKGWAGSQDFPLHHPSLEDSGIALKGCDSFRENMEAPEFELWVTSQRDSLVQKMMSGGNPKTRGP